jgi:DDE superfamily endonuclease
MLRYKNLKKKPKELLAATGLTTEEFEALLTVFDERYTARYGEEQTVEGKARQRRVGGGGKATLRTAEDKLLFILVYEKTYPLQTMLGLQFGLSQGRANIWIHRLLPLVQEARASMKLTPERDGQAVAQSALAEEGGTDLVIDGTERRRQRPQDTLQQNAQYSGKKKAHTDKNLVLVNCHSQKVVYLSPTQPGRKHDKKLADEAKIVYPGGATLGKDTGFQGYEPPGIVAWQPKKSRRVGN